jgi:cytoskeletal protein CcmA (bactofilin family)
MSEHRSSPSESVLAEGLLFEGKLEGTGSLRVTGRVRGQVKLSGQVTVEPGGLVEGEVDAERVVVAGEAKARILARANVHIQDSAAMIGDVEAGSVSVAPGAKIRGRVVSGFQGEAKRADAPGREDGQRQRERSEQVPA